MTDAGGDGAAGRRPTVGAGRRDNALILLAAMLIAAAALALEIGLEGYDAFWLDESWTGAVASQTSWRAVGQQIYWDVNAPLYYGFIKLWSLVFGLSDAALRAPSLIFAAATPLAVALIPSPGLTRAQRLGWAAVLAFWFPTLCYAQEARCYALLLLVCTLQTLAYMRLMQAPGLARAAVWAALAATAILTHYDAIYLGAAQGLLFVARTPRRALASWPAALAFVPAFGWMAFHWPRIVQFAQPGVAWYAPLSPVQLPLIGGYLADGGAIMLPWLAGVALCALSLRLLPKPSGGVDEDSRPLWWTAAAAALSALVLVGMGFLRPSFTFRYLTPDAPGLLLGLIGLARVLAGRRGAAISIATLAAVYLSVSGWMLASGLRMAPRKYNFERASALVAATHPSRLVFLWDHPVDPILHPEQLSALGGFFLHRAGVDVPVDAVVLKPGEDPNARLLDESKAPGSAILWLYDRNVHGTAAITHPPQITSTDKAWRCWRSPSIRFGVLACVRSSAPPAHQPEDAAHPQGPS